MSNAKHALSLQKNSDHYGMEPIFVGTEIEVKRVRNVWVAQQFVGSAKQERADREVESSRAVKQYRLLP